MHALAAAQDQTLFIHQVQAVNLRSASGKMVSDAVELDKCFGLQHKRRYSYETQVVMGMKPKLVTGLR